MTPLTELKKLAELQGKATDGPWTAFTDSYAPTRVLSHKNTICHVIGDSGETDDNAEYIAASRNIDLPALVAYVESLQNDIGKMVIQRESLREALKDAIGTMRGLKIHYSENPGTVTCCNMSIDECRKALEGME